MAATTNHLIARRIGRITFGAVLIVGAGYLATRSLSTALASAMMPRLDAFHIIAITWGVAIGAGLVAWQVARRLRFDADPDKLFAESLVAPTIGVALLLPITLHTPVVLLLGGCDGLDVWVAASAWVTGFAHLVFAASSATRAYQLANGKPAWLPRSIFLLTVGTSCVPFIILLAIPPMIVAVTALPFVPMLDWLERLANRERAELAEVQHALPRARAVALPAA